MQLQYYGTHYIDFGGTGQGGGSKIFPSFFKKYWEIGFRTRLYDRLSPEAYYDCLRRAAEAVHLSKGDWVLDAGCGSGMLLPFLSERLQTGGRYLGMDILSAGLASLEEKARRLDLVDSVSTLRADLSQPFPVEDCSVACAVAHFSIYTLAGEPARQKAYLELYRVLQPGGLMITANPTSNYDAKEIIRASLESFKTSVARPGWWIKKYLIYPLTLRLGLMHIERQIQSGQWHGYRPDELRDEVERAGFAIEQSEIVYGGSGCLVVGQKP